MPAAFEVAADSSRLAAPAAPITTMWRRLSSGFTVPLDLSVIIIFPSTVGQSGYA